MKLIPRISVRVLPKIFGTRYKLASWTTDHKLYNKVITRLFFQDDEMTVIPRDETVRTIDVDISIDSAGERTILPSDVVKGVLRDTKDIFIMNFCLCRKSSKCEDFPVDHGCLFLGKGALKIPEEFGHVATPEEAVKYIDECDGLGLTHIIGRSKLDSIWLSTGKKKDLLTICNCCPCCCLYNMARDISDEISSTFKKMDTVKVISDTEKCVGCGICKEICFVKAISIESGVCKINEKCRGCGRCVGACPSKAITLTYDSSAVNSKIEHIKSLFN